MGKYDADPVKRKASLQPRSPREKALRNQRIAIIAGCSTALVILVVLIVCLLVNAGNTDDGKILPNVYAAGVDLGGMTTDDAKNAVSLAVNKSLVKNPMLVILPDGILELAPEDTHVSVDVDAVVQAAYDYGRTGSKEDQEKIREQAKKTVYTIALLPYMKDLDLQYIYDEVDAFCSTHGSQVAPSVTISGERPAFDPEHPDLEVEHQVLTIQIGAPDYDLQTDTLYDQVLDAYSLNTLELVIDPTTSKQPAELDAEEIFNQYCSLPQNASLDLETFEIIPEVYGYGFDIDEIQRQIDLAGFGDVINVELDFLYPNITAADLEGGVLSDVLAEFTTTGVSSDNRNNNLLISCQKLNGLIIADGETFSFNGLLGLPTSQAGYLTVPGYYKGALTDIMGGGIDQTASTLYYCALLADLEILERTNNSYAVDYIGRGLDVCIEWSVHDLKFTNNTGAPIRIDAIADGASVTIRLVGTDKKSYTVNIITEDLEITEPDTIYQKMDKNNLHGYTNGTVLEEGITGYKVKTIVEHIHKQTGLVIASDEIHTSNYSKRDKKVALIKDASVEDPTPTDPTPTDPTPTDPTDPTE